MGTPDRYPRDLKIAIAREYLKGECGYGQLGKQFGYSGTTVRGFVKWYKAHHPDPNIEPEIKKELQPTYSLPNADKHLSRELELAHLKIAALEMLIENTNKELGYDIGKKGGTGRSSK